MIRIPPSNLLNLNPDHIIPKQTDTPMIVAGIIRYIVKSYDASVSEIGEISAAIPIESNGSGWLGGVMVASAARWVVVGGWVVVVVVVVVVVGVV